MSSLSYERATERWYLALLVAAGALLLVLLVVRLLLLGLPRARRALPLSLAVAVGVSLVVNDSPLDVVAIGLVAYLAAQAYVLAERRPVRRTPVRSRFRALLSYSPLEQLLPFVVSSVHVGLAGVGRPGRRRRRVNARVLTA